ncbi:hypothetical protein HGRIS_010691 [Hohenbuehelia grisea]|uniref:Alanine dehydrogenase/pyridine nucleotide transhydrogenase N-terminal domain-containing protein n=1 Tax=Hohenbuehelia grisea TaxID=104357 RepID=A0ABR3IXJ3_9AGAR
MSTIANALRNLGSSARPPVTVGIRREDPTRLWERRCPLTPSAVNTLVRQGVKVLVQDCDRRVFPIREFVKAGAQVRPDLSPAHIIVGIKETPLKELVTTAVRTPVSSPSEAQWTHRTHVMFSHTAKGQPYNTPLLERFLAPSQQHAKLSQYQPELAPRLVDYELLTEADGKRTVMFGWYAGVAGVLEALSSMAHAHLELGIASPFLYTPRPHTQPSLDALRQSLKAVGKMIRNEGTPKKLGPVIIGLTGNGNVSQGCLHMLEQLPTRFVRASDLPSIVADPIVNLNTIYVCHVKPEDYITTLDGNPYNREHYYSSPQSYRSDFATKVAPYLTLFLNGAGWQPSFPRLMTTAQLGIALEGARAIGGARFTNIGDISCDIEGGLEFMASASTISAPFYKIRPAGIPAHLPPVQIMSVDILPASIPLDASRHFSRQFLPYLESLVASYSSSPDAQRAQNVDNKEDDLSVALARATIAQNGALMQPHRWLQPAVDAWRAATPNVQQSSEPGAIPAETESEQVAEPESVQVVSSRPVQKKKILMLGSGMVAGPAVELIAKRSDVQLLVVGNSQREVEQLQEEHLNVMGRVIDMKDTSTVKDLIEEADLVIRQVVVLLASPRNLTLHAHLIVCSRHLFIPQSPLSASNLASTW